MFSNYFRIALRNLRKHAVYSTINVLGLAIGMTCCLLIFLYVRHELSYDTYHSRADRVYRVVTDIKTVTETIRAGQSADATAPHLKADFPEVQEAVRLNYRGFLLESGANKFQEDQVLIADANLFRVFDFPMLTGNPQTALQAPFSLVLSEKAARKYFGDENPVGKTIQLDGKHAATVTGLVRNVPENTHFKFDIVLSLATIKTQSFEPDLDGQWGSFGWNTYVLLPGGHNAKALEAKLPAFMEKHAGKMMQENKMYYTLFLEPLRDVYLRSDRDAPESGSMANVYIFSVVAVFILLIACFNFTNLTIARATERAREVGVRKVIGADRRQLTTQFLGESVLLSLMAFVLALVLSQLLMPVFNELAGKTISDTVIGRPAHWLTLLALAVGVGVLAGLYPAAVLSAFRPVAVLKGRFSAGPQGMGLRKVLVVFQFTVSVALIAGTLVVYRQLHYMRDQPLGFRKEQTLVLRMNDREYMERHHETLKEQLAAVPGVQSVSASSATPASGNYNGAYTEIENTNGVMQAANLSLYSVDYDYLPQYGIKAVAGRTFSKSFATDSTEALMLNEAAVASLGYPSAEAAVGKRFAQWGRKGRVIGVISNFHLGSLHDSIAPLSLRVSPGSYRLFSLRVKAGDEAGTVERVGRAWQKLVPQRPFEYFFLDEQFDRQYRAEERFGQLFLYFSSLAIFIACLGLLGLISYITLQRTKEIGVRKVLGASVGSIVVLLSKDFLWLVGVALVVAVPVSWYAMSRWLENFAYHTQVGWWVFALSGGLALLIALLTISFQAIKAALANPVYSLRSE
ncbi:MAG: ABC transporter permease [Cytophagales bacterium]|nr:ABC transporter permease [Cytophagales bacterium]